MNKSNPNIIWTAAFVSELAVNGLTAACIAPGSRSTPLALAFAAHPNIRVYSHIDERCAAFFALGLAQASDRPVAVVCTSGTATANFHPAIIEAHQSQVPLLILTGDRPHELRFSGANQTIEQADIYGKHVLWSVDMGLPEIDAPESALNNVRTTAARAFSTANGLRRGAVHINFPFRKPLEPAEPNEPIFDKRDLPSVCSSRLCQGRLTPTREQVESLAAQMGRYEKGLIVCGPNSSARSSLDEFADAVMALSESSGYPIVADPLSGIRYGYETQEQIARIISSYETFLAKGVGVQLFDPPEVVIRFGSVPTGKWLNAYLDGITPVHRVHVRENGVWADDSHKTTLFLQASEAMTCRSLASAGPRRNDTTWSKKVLELEVNCAAATHIALDTADFDAAYIHDLVDALPASARLFIGNSLPIRHLDQFCGPNGNPFSTYGNRGASGIDGTVSCALGVGATGREPLVVILGDVTFAHDLNGLLAAKKVGAPITIVLFNNGGGGIFRRLPISKVEPPFEELFITPHGLDFRTITEGYGWTFTSVRGRDSFRKVLNKSLHDPTPQVIEVVTNGATDHEAWQACCQQILNDIVCANDT